MSRKRYALTGNASHNYRLVPNPNGAEYRVLDWTEVGFFLAHPDVDDQRQLDPAESPHPADDLKRVAADRDRLARENDDLRKQLHDAEVQADRPEPVDPADVRVGDHVEIEAAGGSWMVRGEVANTDLSYVPPRLLIHVATADPCWLDTRRTTMRRLRRAEPQPDPEQVKALAAIVRDLNREGINLTPNEVAERLVRRGVVVRDEH